MSVNVEILPGEIVEQILKCGQLSLKDTANFGFANKYTYALVFCSNQLWKAKFFQRWPFLKDSYVELEKTKNVENWLMEVNFNVFLRKKLKNLVPPPYPDGEHNMEIKYLYHFDQIEHPLLYHFIVDELITTLKNYPVSKLISEHKIFVILLNFTYTDYKYTTAFHQLLKTNPCLRDISFLPRCNHDNFQGCFQYKSVCTMLDDIVDQTKNVLMVRHLFAYPVNNTSKQDENTDNTDDEDMNRDQWSTAQMKTVMAVLCEVMFEKLSFQVKSKKESINVYKYVSLVREIKSRLTLILAIILVKVCERIGITCENIPFSLVANTEHKWGPLLSNDNIGNVEYS